LKTVAKKKMRIAVNDLQKFAMSAVKAGTPLRMRTLLTARTARRNVPERLFCANYEFASGPGITRLAASGESDIEG